MRLVYTRKDFRSALEVLRYNKKKHLRGQKKKPPEKAALFANFARDGEG
jgi:hypothetical protein